MRRPQHAVRILARAALLIAAAAALAAVSGGFFQALAKSEPPGASASPSVTLTPAAAAGEPLSGAQIGEDVEAPETGAPTASPSPSASTSPSPVVLHVGWLTGPDAVDPLSGHTLQSRLILHLGYDLLTGYRAADMGPAPELAESWTHSDDGLEWTFTIRDGALWQDGMPVTAADVAFTFTYVMEHQVSPYVAETAGIQSVEALDENTVVFTCSEPKADMLNMWVPILPEHLWATVDPAAPGTTAPAGLPAVGSGPFTVAAFTPGKSVRLRANSTYWRGRAAVDEVVFTSYTDPAAMVSDLESGEIDACSGIPHEVFSRARSTPGITALAVPGRSFIHLGFTCSDTSSTAAPALRDPLFRRALNWAVDRQRIVATAFGGYAAPGSAIVAPGLQQDPDFQYRPAPEERYGHDLAKADALLTEAGYLQLAGRRVDPEREPLTLRLYASASPPQGRRIARIIAGDLRALGIGVELSVMPESALRRRLSKTMDFLPDPDADLFVGDWVGDRDPSFILSVLTSGQIGGWSDTGWSDPDYDRLYSEQAATLGLGERKSIVEEMQRIVYEQSPYIVIAYPQTLEAIDTGRWQGWVQAPSGTGSALAAVDNVDSYLHVRPKEDVAALPAATPPWVWAALPASALAGAAVAAVAVWWLRRPRAAAQITAVRPAGSRRRAAA